MPKQPPFLGNNFGSVSLIVEHKFAAKMHDACQLSRLVTTKQPNELCKAIRMYGARISIEVIGEVITLANNTEPMQRAGRSCTAPSLSRMLCMH